MVKKSYLLFALFLTSTPLLAASFDCTKAAMSVEKLICNNEDISSLDDQLAKSYKSALEKTSDKEGFKKTQAEWLKQQRLCKDVACLSNVYQERISALNSQTSSSLIASAASQSSQSPAAFYSGKLKLTKGGEFPICNLIFTFLENPKNRAHLGQTVDPLSAIKGVALPEWQEISEEEYLKIIAPESLTDSKAIMARAESKRKYPNAKNYRAKVDFDNDGEFEYVIKWEFNDDNKFYGGGYKILIDEKTIYKNTDQNLYGRIFLYKDEVYSIRVEGGDGKYFWILKTGRGVPGFSLGTWCVVEAIN